MQDDTPESTASPEHVDSPASALVPTAARDPDAPERPALRSTSSPPLIALSVGRVEDEPRTVAGLAVSTAEPANDDGTADTTLMASAGLGMLPPFTDQDATVLVRADASELGNISGLESLPMFSPSRAVENAEPSAFRECTTPQPRSAPSRLPRRQLTFQTPPQPSPLRSHVRLGLPQRVLPPVVYVYSNGNGRTIRWDMGESSTLDACRIKLDAQNAEEIDGINLASHACVRPWTQLGPFQGV